MNRLLVASILPALMAGLVDLGANNSVPAQGTVFRSSVELVELNVVVTDAREHFVRDLSERDFLVSEDGVRQDIAFFAGGKAPLDLTLLIDTSGSMGYMRPLVQKAASGFLRVLRPEDRGAVLGFDRDVTVLQDLTSDVAALRSAVARAGAHGDTSLYSALFVTLRQMGRPPQQASQVRRQAIVVLTDGEENASGLGYDDLLEEARCHGVAIYVIMMQSDQLRQSERVEGHLRPARQNMKDLARETGGLAYFPDAATELSGVYETIAAELTNEYALAYTARPSAPSRALHQISVRVPTRPTLSTRARTSYLAGGPSLRMASLR